MSRRRSALHEAQLNVKLIRSLTGIEEISLEDLSHHYGFIQPPGPGQELEELFDPKRFNLIMHPKSKGSAREWGLENFKQLIKLMPSERFRIFITGTAEEGAAIRKSSLFDENPDVVDLTGRLTLEELIRVINRADGLLAASTGPLHIAAALGKHAVGIYPPIRPMHPGRWAPVGPNASYLVKEEVCNDCRKNMNCHCIREISPEQVNQHFAKIT
jgi:ADP-heptose:LPS heptosyltransferase